MQNKLIKASICLMTCIIMSACGPSQAEPEAQAVATFDATTLPTLTPTATSTSTPTPTATRTLTATPDLPSILAAIAPVAESQGISGAAAYNPDAPGPHRIILLSESGMPHEWNVWLPEEWLPSSVSDTELVILAGPEKEIILGSAYYKNGNQNVRVFRYRFEMDVVIREARTGKKLSAVTLQGSDPGEFPNALAVGITRLDGQHVTKSMLRAWLMCDIIMPGVCKFSPLADPPLEAHLGPINNVAFSSDGQTLVSGPEFGGIVHLWSVSDGVPLRTLDLAYDPIPEELTRAAHTVDQYPGAQLAPDGQTWAIGVEDGTLALGIPAVGSPLPRLEGHEGAVTSVDFSPDGQMVASGSEDQTIRLWAVSDGSLLLILKGHKGTVNSVAFSPDGEMLASASDDESVRLWQLVDGSLLLSLWGHGGPVSSVAFSPDGKTVASGARDGTVRLWMIP